jgi:hypothetical protein
MWLEFPHENTGLEALHVHRESKQLEVRLPLALFQTARAKQFSKDRKDNPNRCRHPGCPECPGGLAVGQVGESIGVFEFLRSDARSCELGLDESETNMRFLLIIRTMFHFGSYCRSYGLNQIVQGHVRKVGKNW